MNRTFIFKALLALAMTFAFVSSQAQVQAGCGVHGASCTSCNTCCPQCQYKCKFEAKKGEEERTCWEIEHDVICVPRVVFPWQKTCCDPCPNNGACIKKVKTLKKHTYKCPKCEYSWTPEKVGTCGSCGSCDSSSCDCGACDSISAVPTPSAMVQAIDADQHLIVSELTSEVIQTAAESDEEPGLVSVPVEEAKPIISKWFRLPSIR